jgi:hypothetical protein
MNERQHSGMLDWSLKVLVWSTAAGRPWVFLPFPRVLTTGDVRVASMPLHGSADPPARNEETALRQQAIKERMSATLAWLDPDGICSCGDRHV